MKFDEATGTNPQNPQSPSRDGHAELIKERLLLLKAQMPAAGYIRQAGLIPHILPFSPASLWRFVNQGRFPAPFKLSPRVTAWKISEVMEWVESAPKIRVHRSKNRSVAKGMVVTIRSAA